jgi:hypothetical protein
VSTVALWENWPGDTIISSHLPKHTAKPCLCLVPLYFCGHFPKHTVLPKMEKFDFSQTRLPSCSLKNMPTVFSFQIVFFSCPRGGRTRHEGDEAQQRRNLAPLHRAGALLSASQRRLSPPLGMPPLSAHSRLCVTPVKHGRTCPNIDRRAKVQRPHCKVWYQAFSAGPAPSVLACRNQLPRAVTLDQVPASYQGRRLVLICATSIDTEKI